MVVTRDICDWRCHCGGGDRLGFDSTAAAAPNQSASPAGSQRADNGEPKVVVDDVTVSRGGRLVDAEVTWNPRLIARPGARDRFNVRLVAVPSDKREDVAVLAEISDSRVRDRNQDVRLELEPSQARLLRDASDVVLSVSQQYDRPSDNDRLLEEASSPPIIWPVTPLSLPRNVTAAISLSALGSLCATAI